MPDESESLNIDEDFSLSEILSGYGSQREGDMHVWFPGRVVSYDRTTHLATIDPMVIADPPIPRLPSIKVAFPGVRWELSTSDTGIVLIADYPWDDWWRTGDPSSPDEPGTHEIAYACFIPGLGPGNNLPLTESGTTTLTALGSTIWLHLGKYDANEKLIRGNSFLSDFDSFLATLSTWVGQVEVAIGPLAGTQPLQTAIGVLRTGIAALDYVSNIVKVD
jgi:hypothetical protein